MNHQFGALLKKDSIQLAQSGKAMMALRLGLPVFSLLILYIIQMTTPQSSFNGIPKGYHLSDLTIPKCYVVSAADSKTGFGAKIPGKACKTVAYSPKNNFTDDIMRNVAALNNLNFAKDFTGVQDQSQIKQLQDQMLVFWSVRFNSSAFESQQPLTPQLVSQDLKILINYNQTYFDNPSMSFLHKQEKLGAEATEKYWNARVVSATSLPLILEMQIQQSILQMFDVAYDPKLRGLPHQAGDTGYAPVIPLTTAIVMIGPLIHFACVVLKILQDKQQGALSTLRLTGMQDLTYIAENLIFQLFIGCILLVICCLTMFGLPGGNDIFAFVNWSQLFQMYVVCVVYATAFGVFLAAILPGKFVFLPPIIIISSTLVCILLESIINPFMFYDLSFIGSQALKYTLIVLIPFSYATMSFSHYFTELQPIKFVNPDSFDVQFLKRALTYNIFYDSGSERSVFGANAFATPSMQMVLIYETAFAVSFLIFAWILMEALPGDSSAQRPFWALLSVNYYKNIGFGFKPKHYQQNENGKPPKSRRMAIELETAEQLLAENPGMSEESQQLAISLLTQEDNDNNALIVQHLHKTFPRTFSQLIQKKPRHKAVKSLNFQVLSGEIFGLGGHNGAGKSTSLQIITGALKPDRKASQINKVKQQDAKSVNNLWINNKFNVRTNLTEVRRRIGYCPQFNTNVFNYLTIDQNFKFFLQFFGYPLADYDRVITHSLASVNLLAWRYKLLSQLSGGMQRRVSICIAMLHPQRKLVILDEPTTGLDPQTKRLIWSIIKMRAKNLIRSPVKPKNGRQPIEFKNVQPPGIILTSHDMNEVNTLSDQVAIMADGQIVAQGTTLHLRNKYGIGFTLTINFNSNQEATVFNLDIKHRIEEQYLKLIDKSGQSLIYALSNQNKEIVSQILKYLTVQQQENQIVDYILENSSLDEVFMKVGNEFGIANGAVQEAWPDIVEQVPIVAAASKKNLNIESVIQKMYHNDHILPFGWINFVLVPMIFVTLSFLIADQLIPFLSSLVTQTFNTQLKQLGNISTQCPLLKASGIMFPKCDGFDRWNQPNLIQMVNLFSSKQYKTPETWFGSTNNVQSIYGEHETAIDIPIFNFNNAITGNPTKLGSIKGKLYYYSVDGQYLPISAQEYRVFNDSNQLISGIQINKTIQTNRSLFNQLPYDIVSTQRIINDKLTNRFDIYQDYNYIDGSQQYQNAQNLDITYLRIIKNGYIKPKASWLPILKNGLLQVNMSSNKTQQELRQYIPISVPPVYLDFDTQHLSKVLNSSNASMKFGPLIAGMIPASSYRSAYENYRLKVHFIPDTRYTLVTQAMQNANITNQFFNEYVDIKLQPSFQPYLTEISVPQTFQVFAINSFSDISNRFVNGVLRSKRNINSNIQFGFQQFPYKYQNLGAALQGAYGVQLSSVFVALAGLIGMTKFGNQIVLDRQSKMRRQLYLNGVNNRQYWIGTMIYSTIMTIVIYLSIQIYGMYVLKLALFQRITIGMQVIVFATGVLSTMSTSIFFGCIYTRTITFTLTMLILIIFSLVYSVFLLNVLDINIFGYILPTIGQITLLTKVADQGMTIAEFFASQNTSMLYILVAQSFAFIGFGVAIDIFFPINGYPAKRLFRRKVTDSVLTSTVEMNAIPESIKVKTIRDTACCDGMDRMDIDILQERQLISDGNDEVQQSSLILRNVQKTFGQFMAIRDISLHLPYNEKGQVLTLLGPNGAAKTTLINLMLKLEDTSAGSIQLLGQNLATNYMDIYKSVSLCSQFDVYLPHLTIRQHFAIFAKVHGVPRKDLRRKVEELAKFVHLDGVLDKKVGQLSGGMKRRLSLGIALIE